MNNITCLTTLRRRLVERKEEYRKEYERNLAGLDKQIDEIDRTLGYLNDAVKPYICPHCNGSGSVRVPDAAGQCEDVTCRVCNGTGFKFPEETP